MSSVQRVDFEYFAQIKNTRWNERSEAMKAQQERILTTLENRQNQFRGEWLRMGIL